MTLLGLFSLHSYGFERRGRRRRASDDASIPNASAPSARSAVRVFEESRVIDDDAVYTLPGNDLRSQAGTDPTPIVSNHMKILQNERVKGLGITISFRILGRRFSKRFWIWKRRYRNLQGFELKDQGDYVYENVSPSPPPVMGGLPLCSLGE